MKHRLVGLVLLLAVAGGGYWWWQMRNPAEDDGSLLYGNVELRETALAFRQSGRLQQVLVEEGGRVEAGQLLARLDDIPYKLAVLARENEVKVAQALLGKLLAGARRQELAELEASLRQARLLTDQRNRDWDRVRKLGEGVSEQAKEESRTAYQMAFAQQQQVAAKLALLREGAREEDLNIARLRLEEAKVALEEVRQVLADTELYAQQGGTVSQRLYEPGSIVGPQQPVFIIALTDEMLVRAYVDEVRLGEAVPGRKVEVTSDARAKPYQGSIGFVSPQAEFTPKVVQTPELRSQLVYRLRIVVLDADDALRQGMPVTVRLLERPKITSGGS